MQLYLLKYQKSYPALIDTLLRSICVDDVIYGANSDDEAYQFHVLSKKIFAEGGFKLQKFFITSALQSRIAANGQGADCNHVNCSDTAPHIPGDYSLVLVHQWSKFWANDTFEFDITDITRFLHELKFTKLNTFRVASRFYDLLGLLSLVAITLKIFFQGLCKFWDDLSWSWSGKGWCPSFMTLLC